jgi:hypothetical protein
MNDMCEAIEDFEEVEKLGQGFSSANPLEEIYIGNGITLRPTFISDIYQYFDRSLNAYLDRCLKIIALLYDFTVQHISRDENIVANDLAQQSSGF